MMKNKRLKLTVSRAVMLLLFCFICMPVSMHGQNKQEEIKPPVGDKWYYEGDEKLYKFDIHPVTPKEGITGGILIYYGHYVKPPYKVEFSMDEYPDGCFIWVNKLCVFPGIKELDNKINESNKIKKYGKPKPPSKEFIERSKKEDQLDNEVKSYYDKLVKNYDRTSAAGSEKIIKEMKKFFKNHKIIEHYFVENAYWFGFVNPYCAIENIFREWKIPKKKLTYEEEKELMKNFYHRSYVHWQNDLKSGVNYSFHVSIEYSETSVLCDIKKILTSKTSKEQKIKKIYRLIKNYDTTLLIYFNLNTNDIKCGDKK